MRDRNSPMTEAEFEALAWGKMEGLVPAVVQDSATGQVLMLGYMNRIALAATLSSGKVTFYSRSRKSLWQKGETSGDVLRLVSIAPDCDGDAVLVRADPAGPVCHTGATSCFGGEAPGGPPDGPAWLAELSRIVAGRAASGGEESYTARLLAEGVSKIAQKVGEEGVEVALAAVTRDSAGCAEETADLLYHLAVLMEALGFGWDEVVAVLRRRHSA